MQLDVEREVAALERMTVGQLRERFGEVFGEQTNARHKQWLIKRIAWKMQANIEGDISERARRRAAELSKDVDMRTSAPKQRVAVAASLVGTIVGELPTGAIEGLGARMLIGSQFGRPLDMWSALFAAAILAGLLILVVGAVERGVRRRMGVAHV